MSGSTKITDNPKLQLLAAKFLADLVRTVIADLKIDKGKVYAFPDSTVVLCWLLQNSGQWKTFVQNFIESITRYAYYHSFQKLVICENIQ